MPVSFLTTDPLYTNLYGSVWLRQEWPKRDGKVDTGIELLVEEKASRKITAIQCKLHVPDYALQKEYIDWFFTASGKAPFKRRKIVSTTDKCRKHAENACFNQQIPVRRLRVQELDQSPVERSDFKLNKAKVGGKQYDYLILPFPIPSEMPGAEAQNNLHRRQLRVLQANSQLNRSSPVAPSQFQAVALQT